MGKRHGMDWKLMKCILGLPGALILFAGSAHAAVGTASPESGSSPSKARGGDTGVQMAQYRSNYYGYGVNRRIIGGSRISGNRIRPGLNIGKSKLDIGKIQDINRYRFWA